MNRSRPVYLLLIALLAAFAAQRMRAEEEHSVLTALSSTTLSGFVDTSVTWWVGPNAGPTPTVAPPANDDFANATPLTLSSNHFTVSNIGATIQAGEPIFPGETSGASVWYVWTVPATGRTHIGFHAPVMPTQAPVAEVVAGAVSSESVFEPGGGISYIPIPDPGSGDGLFASGFVSGTYSHDTYNIDPNLWTAINLHPIFFPVVTVYKVTSPSTLTFVGRGADLNFEAEAGDTFYISVDGQNGTTGAVDFFAAQIPPPSNDNIANALIVENASAANLKGNLVSVTRESGEPLAGAEFTGGSAWFRWKAPMLGTIHFTMAEPIFPMAIFRGSSVTNLEVVARGTTGSASFFSDEGEDYWIAVYRGGQTEDNFSIAVTGPSYRVYELTAGAFMPVGMIPLLHGTRGVAAISYVKDGTSWKRLEVEAIQGGLSAFFRRPDALPWTEMRIVTIDEAPPSPKVEIEIAAGVKSMTLVGLTGQRCQLAASSDLKSWVQVGDFILSSPSVPLSGGSNAGNLFCRVTQKYP